MKETPSGCLFTCDLEWPQHAVLPPAQWPQRNDQVFLIICRLLGALHQAGCHAIFYVLGDVAKKDPALIELIRREGHRIGSHGYWHQRSEREGDPSDQLARGFLPECVGYRSPFWASTPRPGWSGGCFFRWLPYAWLIREIRRSGIFYCHPHDFYQTGIGPMRRKLWLCNPWTRLARLLRDVTWKQP